MNLQELMRVVLYTPGVNGRWGLPVIFEGKPGTAKTSRITRESAALHLDTITLIASLREPTDFAGFAVPEKGSIKRYVEKWVDKCMDLDNCVVFLDELNTAPPSVQKALLRVVLEGVVGDSCLPIGVRFVAAQNSVDDAADGYELSAALANRFGHIQWPAPSAAEWALALNSGFGGDINVVDPAATAKMQDYVTKKWDAAYGRAAALVSGFIMRRTDLLNFKPKTGIAVASPRTWEMATRALSGCFIHNASDDTRNELISAFIGDGPASELIAFITSADLPDATKYLDGTERWTPNPRRMDTTFAMLQMCVNVIKDTTVDATKRKRVDTYMMMLEQLRAAGTTDIAVSGIGYLQKVTGVYQILISEARYVDIMAALNSIM